MIDQFIRTNGKVIGAVVGVFTLLAFCALAWFNLMEKTPIARQSTDANRDEHYMLAASTLLRQHGYSVRIVDTIEEIDRTSPPPGTLMILGTGGLMPLAEAKDLLAWVKRGNTLVARPRVMNEDETDAYHKAFLDKAKQRDADEDEEAERQADEDEADAPAAHAEAEEPATVVLGPEKTPLSAIPAEETDPLGAYFGVGLYPESTACLRGKCANDEDAEVQRLKDEEKPGKARSKAKAKADRPPLFVGMPGAGHWLEVRNGAFHLGETGDNTFTYWGDQAGFAVRVYESGKGRVVMQASNLFSNYALREHDHAELLLGLVALNPAGKQVTIVRNLTLPKWYVLFWDHYRLALISVACFLLLLLWAAVRRFGPLLPMPEGERRSLMEHIDASGAWLWHAEGGRLQLLESTRLDTMKLIERRAPKIARMAPGPMATTLAALVDLPESHVIEALHSDAAPQVLLFTRQIRTLQTLRNHYER